MRKISFYSLILLWSLWSVFVGSNPQTLELHSDEELCSEVEFSIIPVEERISTRTFPSVYQAGSPVWIKGIPLMERFRDPKLVPSHDLLIAGVIHYGDGHRIEVEFNPLLEDVILVKGVPQERHRYYHRRNLNFVSLYWWDFFAYKPGDAARGDLFPDEESKYWMTDKDGNRIPYSHSGSNFYVNFLDPEVQEILIRKGVSIASCGIFDGIMVDNFGRGPGRIVAVDNREERLGVSEAEMEAAVIHIFSEIRARVPNDFIIIVNGGGPTLESLSELINGTHIEFVKVPGGYYNYEDLSRLENALRWNEANLRHPQVNGVMSDGLGTEHPNSKNNNRWMRVFTTLTLTHSDAYVLHNTGFPDAGKGSPNEHYWYDFWDAPLGKPVGEKAQLYKNKKGVSIEGVFIREFTNGWAVYNRSGKEQAIVLPNQATGVTSGRRKRQHTLPDLDGEIYLKTVVQVAPGKHSPLYWVAAKTGTLHRLVGDRVENFVPEIQNATSLTVDAAGEKLYWTKKTSNRTGKIQVANLDGTNRQLVKDLTSAPLDIALDIASGKLYLSNTWGKIQRMNLDGSDFQPNLVTDLKTPQNLVLDTAGGKLYWTEQTSKTTGKIQRANLDGSNVQLVKALTSAPRGMALDGTSRKLYVTNVWGKLQRMNLDGSNFQPNVITGLVSPGQVAVDVVGDKVYWTEQGKLRRADLDGGNIQDVVIGLGVLTDIAFGIDFSRQTGVAAAPMTQTVVEQTSLLANYPNPFNPETWIPYHLANPSNVQITIYDTRGSVVRQLDLGHQHEGYYTSRSRAAYWDGRNAVGERVASGIYFYQLQADGVSSLRKMVILK